MSNPFIGQLLLVPYNFNPRGWAFAAGQLIAISQNTALFSLLGTMYGGNGTSTFALPDLRGRIPIGFGQGPGLQNYVQGEVSGTETVTLLSSEMPQHSHPVHADGTPGSTTTPVNGAPAKFAAGTPYAPGNSALNQQMAATMVQPAGGISGSILPHNNLMPYLTLNWLICLNGVFPSRN
jgi:microcystin-dependent protein